MTTEPLPSGRLWYWRFLEERPEGVYLKRSNVKVDRVLAYLSETGNDYPEISFLELCACHWWEAAQQSQKSTEVPTDAPIST